MCHGASSQCTSDLANLHVARARCFKAVDAGNKFDTNILPAMKKNSKYIHSHTLPNDISSTFLYSSSVVFEKVA